LGREFGAQACGQRSLGGQVVFQREDAQCGGQGVALVELLPDPRGEGKLPAAVPAAPAGGPLRDNRARCVQGAQERLLDAEQFGGSPGGVGREVRVVEVSGHLAHGRPARRSARLRQAP
jgi:hypothetical protein